MNDDTARLVADAREAGARIGGTACVPTSLMVALADSLERAEADLAKARDARDFLGDENLKRAVLAEAENKRLRKALEELVRREGFNFTSWDTAAFARAALAARNEP